MATEIQLETCRMDEDPFAPVGPPPKPCGVANPAGPVMEPRPKRRLPPGPYAKGPPVAPSAKASVPAAKASVPAAKAPSSSGHAKAPQNAAFAGVFFLMDECLFR